MLYTRLVTFALAAYLALARPAIATEDTPQPNPQAAAITEYCLKFGKKDSGGYDSLTLQTTPPIGRKFQHFIGERQKNKPVTWKIRVADRAPEGKIGREDMLEIKCFGQTGRNNQYVHDEGLTGKGYCQGETDYEDGYEHIWNYLMLNTKGFEDKPSNVTERSMRTLEELSKLRISIEEISGGSSN